jgi:hypothetical protein
MNELHVAQRQRSIRTSQTQRWQVFTTNDRQSNTTQTHTHTHTHTHTAHRGGCTRSCVRSQRIHNISIVAIDSQNRPVATMSTPDACLARTDCCSRLASGGHAHYTTTTTTTTTIKHIRQHVSIHNERYETSELCYFGIVDERRLLQQLLARTNACVKTHQSTKQTK